MAGGLLAAQIKSFTRSKVGGFIAPLVFVLRVPLRSRSGVRDLWELLIVLCLGAGMTVPMYQALESGDADAPSFPRRRRWSPSELFRLEIQSAELEISFRPSAEESSYSAYLVQSTGEEHDYKDETEYPERVSSRLIQTSRDSSPNIGSPDFNVALLERCLVAYSLNHSHRYIHCQSATCPLHSSSQLTPVRYDAHLASSAPIPRQSETDIPR